MMVNAFIKPPDAVVQEALKVLKVDFDRPQTAQFLPNLLRAATFPNNPATAAWSGDIYHRIAEWDARHGDPFRAHDYFQASLEHFDPSEALGPARAYRDFARLNLARGLADDAFDLFRQAEALHAKDRPNDKGQRQWRITQVSLLEARVAADDDRTSAVEELVDLALHDIGDFCLRDQHDRVSFVLPYTGGAAKRALHARQLEIDVARRRPVRTVTSIARVVIDTELHIAGRVAGSLIRKERRLPRP